MSEWINERFRRHQARINEHNQRMRWDTEAEQASGGMFQALLQQVRFDLTQYGELFPKNSNCTAHLTEDVDGFVVVCQGKSVKVQKPIGTVIKFTYSDQNRSSRSDGFIKVAADDSGHPRFRHGDKFLDSAENASEAILGPVLCGG